MDLLLALIIINAFIIMPGLLNYYANRWFSGGAPSDLGRWEQVIAGWLTSFVVLSVLAVLTLFVSLGYDGLRRQIADFVREGLYGYARVRPIALSGVLTLVAVGNMALMTILGALGLPGEFLAARGIAEGDVSEHAPVGDRD